MDFIQGNLLTLIIFSPLAAALVLFLLPEDEKTLIRRLALAFSLIPLLLALIAWFSFDRVNAGLQFVVQAPWFPAIGSSFHIGLDGISLPMVLLTAILTPLAILASFNIEDKVRMYMVLFLVLESAMLGLFASLDLIIFFIFWEIGLVPMYFLIRIWGGADRDYASFKFMIYTMAGSLGLLLSIQIMGLSTGTFDIIELMDSWVALSGGTLANTGLPVALVKSVAYWLFVIAFAIKVPIWPFHTWLPDAHTQAPTAGSMILAGVVEVGRIRIPAPGHSSVSGSGYGYSFRVGLAGYGQYCFRRAGGVWAVGLQAVGGVLLH